MDFKKNLYVKQFQETSFSFFRKNNLCQIQIGNGIKYEYFLKSFSETTLRLRKIWYQFLNIKTKVMLFIMFEGSKRIMLLKIFKWQIFFFNKYY